MLLLLPATANCAAPPDPSLRPSEQLDTRRIGKVSDDERAVLRVEWRAAASGADEAHTLEEMLDRLRRMEITIGQISRLIRDIPAAQAPAPVAAEAPAWLPEDPRLILAGSAAFVLLALWWSRRRNGASPAPTAPAAPIAPIAQPPAKELAHSAPLQKTPAAVPPPAMDAAVIQFSLEEADAETVARANARQQALRATAFVPAADAVSDPNVDPTLELAEIMLSMGLEQGAAQALVEYSEANPRQALYHWLKLLDIYRSGGQQEDLRETAEKLRQHFNIQALDSAGSEDGETPTLENFVRAAEHVQQIWSRPAECTAYLRHLLEDNRDGTRAGFPRPVAEEILLLIELLKESAEGDQPAGAQRATT